MQVDSQDFLSTSSMQVVSTIHRKSAVPGRFALKTVSYVSSGSKHNLGKHVSSLLAALEQHACI